jgi:hypothetical protein
LCQKLIETDSDSNRPISKEKNHPNKRFPIPTKPVSETFGQLLPTSNPCESLRFNPVQIPGTILPHNNIQRETTGLPDTRSIPLKDLCSVLLKTNPIP